MRRYLPLLVTPRNVMTNGGHKWVILALWKIRDYKASRDEDCSSQYMVRGVRYVLPFISFL